MSLRRTKHHRTINVSLDHGVRVKKKNSLNDHGNLSKCYLEVCMVGFSPVFSSFSLLCMLVEPFGWETRVDAPVQFYQVCAESRRVSHSFPRDEAGDITSNLVYN